MIVSSYLVVRVKTNDFACRTVSLNEGDAMCQVLEYTIKNESSKELLRISRPGPRTANAASKGPYLCSDRQGN